jgi:hypothetical protein
MTENVEQVEEITYKDPYSLEVDPFEITKEELSPEEENDVFSNTEEEEKEEVEDKIKEKEETPFDDQNEKTEDTPEPDDALKLSAAIAITKLIAGKKGVEENIDFDAIESLEDIEEIIESFTDLDNLVAVENLKQSNKTIAQITDFIQKGGNPDEVLNILTKSKEITEIDISTESGAKELIREYYKNVVKLPDDIINKKIKKLEEADSLISEAEDFQPLYQEQINKELENKAKKLEEKQKADLIILQQKKTDFISKLKANQFTREVAGELMNTAFSEVSLPNGEKKILLDAKIDRLKENPDYFLKLVSFINNPNLYDQQILANKGSEIVQRTAKQRLIINSKPKETPPSPIGKAKTGGFTLKF